MAIEQERTAEPIHEMADLFLDRTMVWPVGLFNAFLELALADGTPPKIAVLLRARGDDPEPTASPCGDAATTNSVDHRRIDLIFGSIAIYRRARSAGDHRAATALPGPPDQAIDERVLESGKRRLAR